MTRTQKIRVKILPHVIRMDFFNKRFKARTNYIKHFSSAHELWCQSSQLNMVVNLLKNFKQYSAFPFSPLFTSIFHLPRSFSLLMNFYFTSQQVTSGLMPEHTKSVSAHSSNIEMKTHKQKKMFASRNVWCRSAFCCWRLFCAKRWRRTTTASELLAKICWRFFKALHLCWRNKNTFNIF